MSTPGPDSAKEKQVIATCRVLEQEERLSVGTVREVEHLASSSLLHPPVSSAGGQRARAQLRHSPPISLEVILLEPQQDGRVDRSGRGWLWAGLANK